MSPFDLAFENDMHVNPPENDTVLLIGDDKNHALDPSRIITDIDQKFSLVAVTDKVEQDALFSGLYEAGKLLVPILDFTGGTCIRSDYQALALTPNTFKEACAHIFSIHEALHSFPTIPDNMDRAGLTALALAHSRACRIEGVLDFTERNMISYPLLAGIPDQRTTLKNLAAANLLKRHFFERTQCCMHCGSARLVAREVCQACESSDIQEATLVHHYSCGHQGVKSTFKDGGNLSCPKCDKELNHFGVDYDTPGHVFLCSSCGETSAEPEVSFACTDCHKNTRGDDARTREWHHFELTMTGRAALLESRLPVTGLEALVGDLSNRRSPRDLGMLIDMQQRVSGRYARAYSLLLVKVDMVDEESMPTSAATLAKLQKTIVDLLLETMRETDFLAILDEALVVLLPETPHANCQVLVERLNEKIAQFIGPEKMTKAECVADERISDIVNLLSKG